MKIKKVFRVIMPYHDGYSSHGEYRSPLFADRANAEKFMEKMLGIPPEDRRHWWCDEGLGRDPYIEEQEILYDCPELENAENYLYASPV